MPDSCPFVDPEQDESDDIDEQQDIQHTCKSKIKKRAFTLSSFILHT